MAFVSGEGNVGGGSPGGGRGVRVYAQLLRSHRVTRWNIAFALLQSAMKILIENASSLKPSALISKIWKH